MAFLPIAEDIYLLEGRIEGVPNLFASYLLKEGVIIEPGPAAFSSYIEANLKEMGYDPSLISYIIPTHIHLDHGGGAGYLAQRWTQAKVVVHPQGARHLIDPSRLIASSKLAFGDDFEDRYGPLLAIPEEQVYVPQDGEVISVGGRELSIIYSPGHAPHHLAIYDGKSGGLFCGEALGVPQPQTSFPLPFAAPPGFDVELYLESMEKLKALSPKLLFYSHDGVVEDPNSLIDLARENAQKFADIILEGLRRGESPQQIEQRVKEYVVKAVSSISEQSMAGMTVQGYIFYFQKKGVV